MNIFTKLDCRNTNLQNSDIVQIEDFTNLQSLIIDNNPAVTNISPLANLPYLSLLSMEGNANINLNLTKLKGLKDLYLGNMGLTSLPDLSTNTNLEFLDISNNQIASGFTQLPVSLTVLVLDNNDINSCDGLAGKTIETVSLAGEKVISTANCNDISGLQNLNVKNAANLIGKYNIDDEAGFCSLILNNTGITSITGSRPVNVLSLINNVDLKENQLIKLAWNSPFEPIDSYPDLIPMRVDISGSNNTLCGNDDKNKLLWNTNTITDMSQPFSTTVNDDMKDSPLCYSRIAQAYISPDVCKPDPLSSLDVYEDINTSRRYIRWQKDINHDYQQWGVNGYKILAKRNGINIAQRYVALDEPQPYIMHALSATSYEIQACIDSECGYSLSTAQPFQNALSRVSNLSVEWINLAGNSKEFKFTFSYPIELIQAGNPASRPDYFKITPDVGTEKIVNYSSNIGLASWEATGYNYNTLQSTSFKVSACNVLLGCAPPIHAIVENPVISLDILAPDNFDIYTGHSSFTLRWNVDNNQVNELTNIDYFEIHETQPDINANQVYSNSISSTPTISRQYYLEPDELWDDVNKYYYIKLVRQTRGRYKFKIRSCKRDRVNGDVCSAYIEYSKVINNVLRNHITLPLSGVEAIIYHEVGDVVDIEKPIDFGWYNEPDNNKILSWTYPSTSYQPDYFYITNSSTSNNNKCKIGNKTLKQFTVSYADKSIEINTNTNAPIDVWNTQIKCNNVGANSSWEIQACLNGIGCSEKAFVDVPTSSAQVLSYLKPIQTTNAPEGASQTSGGPGDLLPGMWWNQELSGTGWHFYWANNLGLSSNHENYGNTYDLIGYWFAYKQINGIWTPTWFETRLIQRQGTSSTNGFFEGDIFYYDNFNKVDTGNLKLYFNEGSDNNHRTATLYIDADYEINTFDGNIFTQSTEADDLGPYVAQSDGSLRLDIEDVAIGIIGETPNARFGAENDADHYSGLWQNNDKKVSVLTWIERGMEVSTIATFDTVNIPIWFQAVTCDGENCNRSGAAYFDDYKSGGPQSYALGVVPVGFNPLLPKPANHDFHGYEGGYVQYIGNIGRCFTMDEESTNPSRFRKAKFWADIRDDLKYEDTDIGSYTRTIVDMGGAKQLRQ